MAELQPKPSQLQRRLRRFFAKPIVEILVGVLIVISVSLTLLEFWFDHKLQTNTTNTGGLVNSLFGVITPQKLSTLEHIGDVITVIFIVELTLRYLAIGSWRRFFAEYWIDVLATIPLFRVFRTARALRFLRLFRLFRLMGVLSRLSSHYPYILRRGAVDFMVISGLLVVSIVFGTLTIMKAENSVPSNPATINEASVVATDDDFSLENSFWFSVYTLFAGEPVPAAPQTLTGRIVSVFLMFMGLTIFAIFAGTVSAFMVDRLRVEGKVMNLNELEDHVIICGWTPKTEIIVKEYRSTKSTRSMPIVIISQLDPDQVNDTISRIPNVFLISDDFTKMTALTRAGVERARTCLVLSDTTGGRSEQDADARSILAALTAEKINPDVYTCAELFNRDYASHLDVGNVNDYVISGEYGAHMLAQAARNRGLMDVLSELLTSQHGNEFHRLKIPDDWIGTNFNQQFSRMKSEKDIVLIAVHSDGTETKDSNFGPNVNPTNYLFREGDEVVVISHGEASLI